MLADETTDIARIEQMSLCVRYIDQTEGKLREDFLLFVPASDITGQGLSSLILNKLKQNGVDCETMVSQGYDGASAMSGHLHGAQAYIRAQYPMALYVHCSALSLKLVLADSCSVSAIRNCMGTIQAVGPFFWSSPQRNQVLKDMITKHLPRSRCTTLVAMCETSWVYKHEGVLRFKEIYTAIVNSLEKLEE